MRLVLRAKLRRAAAFQANPLAGAAGATAAFGSNSDPPARIKEFTTAGGTDARAQGTKIVYIWRAKEG